MKFIIEKKQVEQVMSYIGPKPYLEVAGLMQILMTLPALEEEKDTVGDAGGESSCEQTTSSGQGEEKNS